MSLTWEDLDHEPDLRTQIIERGPFIGLARPIQLPNFSGTTLLVVDREYAVEWFFDAMSNGSFDGSSSSRFLSHNALENRLEIEVSRSRRYANPLAVLMIN